MNKADFIMAVAHEVKTLRKLATKREIDNLNLELFNPEAADSCIYGQMTGHCASKRAKRLMDRACIIVTKDGGADEFINSTFANKKHLINGKNEGQGWKDEGGSSFFSRDYSHLSALEAYICMKGAKVKNIYAFLKGEKKELVL